MDNKESVALLKDLVMLLTVYVRRGVPQNTLIKELNDVGFQQKRIAEIVGTTANTVNVTLHRLKKGGTK